MVLKRPDPVIHFCPAAVRTVTERRVDLRLDPMK